MSFTTQIVGILTWSALCALVLVALFLSIATLPAAEDVSWLRNAIVLVYGSVASVWVGGNFVLAGLPVKR